MTEKLYRIKDLEWQGDEPKLEGDRVTCYTVFGSMWVGFPFLEHEGDEYLPGAEWRWGYCFNEYYDEGEHECDSLEDGKAKAEAHYRARMARGLAEVKE